MQPPTWSIELSRPAAKQLERAPDMMQQRIVAALDGLTAQPPQGDIKKLAGSPSLYRLRVGSWRVVFQRMRERRIVVILTIEPRDRAYRRS